MGGFLILKIKEVKNMRQEYDDPPSSCCICGDKPPSSIIGCDPDPVNIRYRLQLSRGANKPESVAGPIEGCPKRNSHLRQNRGRRRYLGL